MSMEALNETQVPIILTDAAKEAMQNALKEEGEGSIAVRVSVRGGGCSGYQYNLDFENEVRDDDHVIELSGGFKVVIDPISASMLKGTTIDYIKGLNGSGFKFNNPNAKRTCGCGHSFS